MAYVPPGKNLNTKGSKYNTVKREGSSFVYLGDLSV
jgi:hypothetical protein